jgi:benzoyl-CoA-dihydrodiol lyase
VFKTQGDPALVLESDAFMERSADHWFVRETLGLLRRTLARLDVTSRSLFALIENDSCFVGTLFELALACDRSYMLDDPDTDKPALIALDGLNFGHFPMVNGQSRMGRRFHDEADFIDAARATLGEKISATQAEALGLVTLSPDSIDWDDEIRIALEERRALSPDALTGLEANLRFGENESMETRIFGRLTAWQNWIFNRPNAAGEKGALKLYGKGEQASFDWNRV